MMQYFEWYLPPECSLWKKIIENVKHLENMGITHIWLPPAYKGAGGKYDVGYGVYDLYDLGEFDQKGSIATKYGTKDEYLKAIKVLKENNIKVLADIVLNHKMGADETEDVLAVQDDANDRNVSVSEAMPIRVWTKYTFPGRGDQYSSFKWNWTHFHGIDWDENTGTAAIYKFYGKHWDESVDKENGNFDYLMGADIDLNNFDVINELKNWGHWYLNETNVDGFRLDAVKHIRAEFYPEWLGELRKDFDRKLYAVGEYWSVNIDTIRSFLEKTGNVMNLFDVPLHYNLFRASISNGEFNMSEIFNGTLVESDPDKAITFVDNHDTEPGQALESFVLDWFKLQSYILIMLTKSGMPCVFYGDYYGIPEKGIEPKDKMLDMLLKIRKYYAYGDQIDYFNDQNIIGFVRTGDYEHPDSGLVAVLTDAEGGSIQMNVGPNLADTVFYDCTGNISETVYVDAGGNGIFYCNDGSASIWIKQSTKNETEKEGF